MTEMIEKENIILKHTQLAQEYAKLANSDNLLSVKEWKKINKRMNEILIEINKLKEIESTWDEFKTPNVSSYNLLSIKMLNIEEVAKILNVSRQQITILREIGIIQAIKTGKNYMFTLEEIQRFQREYVGYDVSNKVKAIEAYNLVEEQKKATAPTVAKKATHQNYFQ
ncbi:helix-turn-helix domain-containing protein [Thomasclavelia cocleata]|uniref:helix-turn-helix domain-containing protein n=1 Tax=Thomasclavelia cocleata TaxID=69824 RepID=UPI002558138C|nr:helix-turn-helix domain-containing protein [Thomasclavelia cocleata]